MESAHIGGTLSNISTDAQPGLDAIFSEYVVTAPGKQRTGTRMDYFTAFIIGAVIGCVSLAWSLVKRPICGGYPIQGFLTSAIFGGFVISTIIWAISKMVS